MKRKLSSFRFVLAAGELLACVALLVLAGMVGELIAMAIEILKEWQ